jgi:hypothetical protein
MRIRLDDTAIAWQKIEDDIVVIDLRNSDYFSLNESAASLWPLLAAGTDDEELVTALVDHYGIDRSTALGDVSALLEDLRGRQIVTVTESP